MIRGRFDGDIDAKGALYIDEGASVNVGRIRAMSIIVAGSVRGDLEAVDKVEFRSSAQVRGNVRTAKLRIADGVLFEGRCEMVRDGAGFDPFAASPNVKTEAGS
jgi:cytoskeletal protein CcmA (bactofilin family)